MVTWSSVTGSSEIASTPTPWLPLIVLLRTVTVWSRSELVPSTLSPDPDPSSAWLPEMVDPSMWAAVWFSQTPPTKVPASLSATVESTISSVESIALMPPTAPAEPRTSLPTTCTRSSDRSVWLSESPPASTVASLSLTTVSVIVTSSEPPSVLPNATPPPA